MKRFLNYLILSFTIHTVFYLFLVKQNSNFSVAKDKIEPFRIQLSEKNKNQLILPHGQTNIWRAFYAKQGRDGIESGINLLGVAKAITAHEGIEPINKINFEKLKLSYGYSALKYF